MRSREVDRTHWKARGSNRTEKKNRGLAPPAFFFLAGRLPVVPVRHRLRTGTLVRADTTAFVYSSGVNHSL